jgi:hypothetical protein
VDRDAVAGYNGESPEDRIMKALEFQSQINPDATLSVPPEVARQVPPDQPLRVLLLVAEDAEAGDWERLTIQEFLQGYTESDAIYDQLPAG